MTAAALTPSKEYIENGVTLAYAVPFRFRAATHIKAQRISTAGVVTELAYGTDYSVTGGETDAGGTLTVTVAGAAGTRLRIRRETPRSQDMDYTTGDNFPAESHEAALDKAILIDQEQDQKIDDTAKRALLVPDGETAPELQSKAARAGKFPLWSATGEELIGSFGTGADIGLREDLAGEDGSKIVGYKHPGTGAIQRDNDGKWQEIISVADWGIKGDGATDNTVAMAALRAYLATRAFAGNTARVIWPAGRYLGLTSPNWAIEKLHLDFEGEVWLINTGPGSGFILDGGAVGPGVRGIRITGFPRLYGEPGSGHGYYVRSIHRSVLDLICRGAGSAFSGFYCEWGVSNDIRYHIDYNDGGLYSTPARGMTLTSRVSDGLQTSYCKIDNPEFSGLPIGLYLDGSLGNSIRNGAFQANQKGCVITVNAKATKFSDTDFEVNSTNDLEDEGESTQLKHCDFEKGPVFKAASRKARMYGGETMDITIDAGASDVSISETIYNRSLVPGTGAITDAGTRSRFVNVRNGKTNELFRRLRLTPAIGASPYTYTNTSGNIEAVIVSGGIVSSIVLARLAGDAIAPTSGEFILGPGDAIIITYSSAPTFVVWPLCA